MVGRTELLVAPVELRLITGGRTYGLPVKDKLDACGFAVMADDDGVIHTQRRSG
jgi:hypothetical protein